MKKKKNEIKIDPKILFSRLNFKKYASRRKFFFWQIRKWNKRWKLIKTCVLRNSFLIRLLLLLLFKLSIFLFMLWEDRTLTYGLTVCFFFLLLLKSRLFIKNLDDSLFLSLFIELLNRSIVCGYFSTNFCIQVRFYCGVLFELKKEIGMDSVQDPDPAYINNQKEKSYLICNCNCWLLINNIPLVFLSKSEREKETNLRRIRNKKKQKNNTV